VRIAAGFDQGAAVVPAQPDAAARERLQALGYVGSFAPAAAGRGGDDPKDHIDGYRAYREQFNQALVVQAPGPPGPAVTTADVVAVR